MCRICSGTFGTLTTLAGSSTLSHHDREEWGLFVLGATHIRVLEDGVPRIRKTCESYRLGGDSHTVRCNMQWVILAC